MRKYIQLVFLLSLISHLGLAQIPINDLMQLKNTPLYKDGEEALSKHFKRSLRSPSMQVVCTVLGVIKVARNGKIEDIGTLNKVPDAFKSQFIQVAKQTDGNWLPSNETSDFFYVVMPIQFSYSGANYEVDLDNIPKYFREPIVVMAYLPGKSAVLYKEDNKYLEKVEDAVGDGKDDKAIELMEFLIGRQPFNADYYKRLIGLYRKVGKNEEATYYTSLIEVLSDKQ